MAGGASCHRSSSSKNHAMQKPEGWRNKPQCRVASQVCLHATRHSTLAKVLHILAHRLDLACHVKAVREDNAQVPDRRT